MWALLVAGAGSSLAQPSQLSPASSTQPSQPQELQLSWGGWLGVAELDILGIFSILGFFLGPGTWDPIPDTWYPIFRNHRVRKIQESPSTQYSAITEYAIYMYIIFPINRTQTNDGLPLHFKTYI